MNLTPLVEEEDAAPLGREEAPIVVHADNDPTHRRLRAIAGAGSGYIFIVITPDGASTIDWFGFAPESIPVGLRELADNVEGQL